MGEVCRNNCVAASGVMKLLIGLGMIALGVLNIVYTSWSATFCQGLWGGFWIASTGFVGILGGCCRSRGMNTAFLLFTVFSTIVVAGGVFVISLFSYLVDYKYTIQPNFAVIPGWSYPTVQPCTSSGYGQGSFGSLNQNYNPLLFTTTQAYWWLLPATTLNPFWWLATTPLYYGNNNNNFFSSFYTGFGSQMPSNYLPCPNNTAAIFDIVLCALAAAAALLSLITAPVACCAACAAQDSKAQVAPTPQGMLMMEQRRSPSMTERGAFRRASEQPLRSDSPAAPRSNWRSSLSKRLSLRRQSRQGSDSTLQLDDDLQRNRAMPPVEEV